MTEEEELDVLTAKGQLLASYGISLLTMTCSEGVEDAALLGSGILVQLGQVSGILTAGHVLTRLPPKGEVGVMLPVCSRFSQRMKLRIEHCQSVILDSHNEGRLGPDIGFLRLPLDSIGSLKAVRTFYSLDRRYSLNPTEQCITAATGGVEEWTEDAVDISSSLRRRVFNSLLRSGEVTNTITNNYGCDVLTFDFFTGSTPPTSYGGMSGGGLWKIPTLSDKKPELIGVLFHESEISNNDRQVYVHGTRTIYDQLVPLIVGRWPSEAN